MRITISSETLEKLKRVQTKYWYEYGLYLDSQVGKRGRYESDSLDAFLAKLANILLDPNVHIEKVVK